MNVDLTAATRGAATTMVSGVPVVHWNPVRGGVPVTNFGDLLGPELVARVVSGMEPTSVGDASRALLSVGSVLHLAPEKAVIWGTGANGKQLPQRSSFPASLDVRSVRGPWTRRYLRWLGHDVPEVYGDPALLVPYLMPELSRASRAPRRDVIFVPNLNDRDDHSAQSRVLGIPVQDPCDQLFSVLANIAGSRFVVGSSLHAVVVAESLGIPARFVRSEHEHPFKYLDYLAGTGRWSEPLARTVEEALALGPMPEPRYDAEAILDAFPGDLWSGGQVGPAAPTRSPAAVDRQPDSALSDAEWVVTLSTLRTSEDDVTEYGAVLEDAAESMRADAPGTGLDRLIELRRWIHPEVRSDQLAARLRDADRAVLAGSGEHFLNASHRAREGLAVEAYGVIRRRTSTVLSLVVRLTDSARSIEEFRLSRGDGVVAVGSLLLPTGAAQLDLDVIVPADWGDLSDADLTAAVVFIDGTTESASLTWVNEIPHLGVGREQTMVAVGQEGA